jgi:CMP-N,N'-diacetyllegionaminic acid synthase
MADNPRILAIIPARAGSKGVPQKNMRLLGGKPLVHYTLVSASKSKLINTTVLSTDCEKTLNFASRYPDIHNLLLRPKVLAQDDTPTIDVVKHVIHYYDKIGVVFDYVCLLQPTCPFRAHNLIDKSISRLLAMHGDSLVTVRKIPAKYNPNWALKSKDDYMEPATGDKVIISRRQDLPQAWYRDGQIYITRMDVVRRGQLYGNKLIGFVNEDSPDVNIDSIQDWLRAETILKNGITS